MNYGLYLSASGVQASLYRQDVFAHNLANVETPAFKPDIPGVQQRAPESIEDGFGGALRHNLLDRLGGGVFAGPQRISFDAGPARQTGSPLDLMLGGEDTFFAVEREGGPAGEQAIHLTRDGRFQLDQEGFLVTTAGQHYVLDANDQRIQLDEGGPVSIASDGSVLEGDEVVAQLQVTEVSDRDALRKRGQSLFAMPDGRDLRTEAADPSVRSGFLEGSGVDPIRAMLKVVAATKSATGNANMIRYHDLTMDRAVNVLGRVVA